MFSLWFILLLQALQAINFPCMAACLASQTSIGKHQESNFLANIFFNLLSFLPPDDCSQELPLISERLLSSPFQSPAN